MTRQFKIPHQLILPFACHKFDRDYISLVGVSTDGTYFETETHCVHINRSEKEPLRLADFKKTWVLDFDRYGEIVDTWEAIDLMREVTLDFGNLQTKYERQFVEMWFEMISWPYDEDGGWAHTKNPHVDKLDRWAFGSLLPLPQAHIYAKDPLERYSFSPKNMFKVDFAFWTGRRLIAVEIDGSSHVGNPDHIRKDRMLQRAGVQVVHILNSEIEEHRTEVIWRLLPITPLDWDDEVQEGDRPPINPFSEKLPF